jgi:Fe-S-cluster containining protein
MGGSDRDASISATGPQTLPPEAFKAWLDRTRDAQRTRAGSDVPCGDCRGCCTSAYFIHIRPDETAALAAIPKNLRFRAPGLPKGHVVMGYDEKGHCPMFKHNACSIYAHRPQTCRDYDCRVFAATGIPADEGKPAIAEQVGRWKFDVSAPRDKSHFDALRAAAAFLKDRAALFPPGFVPANNTQLAVVALKVYDVLLDRDPTLEPGPSESATVASTAIASTAIAAAMVAAYLAFEKRKPA